MSQESPAASTRSDKLQFHRWQRAPAGGSATNEPPYHDKFARFNVQPEVPAINDEIWEKFQTYEKFPMHQEWSKEETEYLIDVYLECNGKWPVIIDQYSYPGGQERSMEDLKACFYSLSAFLLQLNTPKPSMTTSEYTLFETLNNFNPAQEASRKKLGEGHLYRRQAEVDEESVLLSELQRIMLNQATVETEREELRGRLTYPHANTNGYQYTTSQALTGLWQQLLAADRMKKNQRLRPTGNLIDLVSYAVISY